MNDDFWIPRTLDDPPLFFMWDFDTAGIWIVCLVLGGVMQMFILGLVCAVVLGRGYARLKDEGGKGLIVKIIYWFAPTEQVFGSKYSSHIREYIGG